MRIFFFFLIVCLSHNISFSQEKDTSVLLENIIVRGYNNFRSQMTTPASIVKLGRRALESYGSVSLVPVVNSIPGVRMEERSPGSYRFSIRGSLLRSPFGVRNIKVYWKDMPLTDAGGNTYLNLIDINGVGSLEILKGPGSSVFGAGTGGVVNFQEPLLIANKNEQYTFQTNIGSFGTLNATVQSLGKTKNAHWHLMQSHFNSNGYRENASMRRDVTQANISWNLTSQHHLDALVIYSNLMYRTPGGLTFTQVQENPRMSRPASGTLPSALQQKAGVFNSSWIAGLSDSIRLAFNWSILNSVVVTHTDFKNPFISNYEKRNEMNFSFRSALKYTKKFKNNEITWTNGIESQSGIYRIDSSGNLMGIPDMNVVRDLINTNTGFVFSQMEINLNRQWNIQWGLSLNNFGTSIQRIAPLTDQKKIFFDPKLMPRISILHIVNSHLSIYGSLSRGYSTPTIAEIKPSASGIYNGLQAEYGYNKEIGFKSLWLSNKLKWDINAFHFNLMDAIVRRTNEAGQEYFVNAGGTLQKGLESNTMAILYSNDHARLKQVNFSNSVTLFDFTFRDYTVAGINYNNNKVTGVPGKTIYSAIDFQFKNGLFALISMNYNSSIPLNDKNDTFADPFQLWQTKLGYKHYWRSGILTDIYVVVDNIANVNYSLGNDINAFGKRFFNPAPGRNYIIGFKFQL